MINTDGQLNDSLLGFNLFAYCENDPVNKVDPFGNKPNLDWFRNKASDVEKWFEEKIVKPTCNTAQKIATDCMNFDFNNSNVEKVYKSNYFSSYKGKLVVRHSSKLLTSWAINDVIFLNHNNDKDKDLSFKTDTLNHEYGHTLQQEELGTIRYLAYVALPSMTINLISRKSEVINNNYYNFPWEYDADMRGGVVRPEHNSLSSFISSVYWSIMR